jgi:hypothetical protein
MKKNKKTKKKKAYRMLEGETIFDVICYEMAGHLGAFYRELSYRQMSDLWHRVQQCTAKIIRYLKKAKKADEPLRKAISDIIIEWSYPFPGGR